MGRSLPQVETTLFGALVLAEIPKDLSDKAVARFEKACYLRPEFDSMGHVCYSHLGAFVAKSVKLLVPLDFDVKIAEDFLVPFSMNGANPAVVGPKPQQIFDSVDPDSVKSVPAAFIKEYGPTEGCNTCKRKSAHGYSHSRKCVERYRQFLRAEGSKLKDDAAISPSPGRLVKPFGAQPAVANDVSKHGDLARVDEASVQEKNADLLGKEDASDQYEPSIAPEVLEVDEPAIHDPPAVAASDAVDMDVEEQPADVIEVGDVDMPEKMCVDSMLECPLHEFDPVTVDKIRENIIGMNQAMYFRKDDSNTFEYVDLCGEQVCLYRPAWILSDVTGDALDPEQSFEGMKVETTSMTNQEVGRPMGEKEAKEVCKKFSIKPISCRWVNNQKTESTVRSRLVARQIARGGSNAKDLAISSPTSSTESLRICLAEAGWKGLCIVGLDVSTAFMASPITEHVVLLLPNSYTWSDGSRVFLYCYKAINGLRSSGKAWVLHLGNVAKQAKLEAGKVETTLFCGYFLNGDHWIQIVSYVDDLLIFGESMAICKQVYEFFASKLRVKETGRIDSALNGGGRIKFLGREISRKKGSHTIEIAVPDGYLQPCFDLFGISKGSDTPPDFRVILDDASPQASLELSQESFERYRSVLGKLSWMSQTRQDLVIYLSLLSLGMARPLQKHEKAMRMLLRFLFNQQSMIQSYPAKEQLDNMHVDEYRLLGYTDSSWAPLEILRRRSISGGFIFLHGCCIKSYSRIQQTVALSSCESELSGICELCVEMQGIERIAAHLFGIDLQRDLIRTDSQAALRVLKGQGLQRRSRHVEIRVFHVQDRLQDNELEVEWAEGSRMIADLATKTLGKRLYETFSTALGFQEIEVPRTTSGAKRLHSMLQLLLGFQDSGVKLAVSNKKQKKPLQFVQQNLFDLSTCPISTLFELIPVDKIYHCDELNVDAALKLNFNMIFIEICSNETSVLCDFIHKKCQAKGSNFRVLCIRIVEKTQVETFCESVCDFLKGCKSKRPNIVVFSHLSAPCTGGSSLMYLQEDARAKIDQHFSVFKSILNAAKMILDVSDDWSLALPKRNNYWKQLELQQYLVSRARARYIFCCAHKLCQMLSDEECMEKLRPSKAYLVMSTSISVIHELAVF